MSSAPLVRIGEKALATLKQASQARKDNLFSDFSADTCSVHPSCRKDYTRKHTIQKCKRLRECNTDQCSSAKESRVTRKGAVFDFQRQCLFCGLDVVDDTKLPTHRRRSVSQISTLSEDSFKQKALEGGDATGMLVLGRIEGAIDLVAAEGKYHRDCRRDFFRDSKRPSENRKEEAFAQLCHHLDEDDECQYTIQEIEEMLFSINNEGPHYSRKQLRRKLLEKYGQDIVFISQNKSPDSVCFWDRACHVLQEKWANASDHTEEDIVDMAAMIVRNAIRCTHFNTNTYPDMTTEDSLSAQPHPLLQRLINGMLAPKSESQSTRRKCASTSQVVTAACRPRSYVSPMLLSLSVYLHKMYGSKELISLLHNFGLSASYQEATQLESALLQTCGSSAVPLSDGFIQFAFDNADVNVATLTGKPNVQLHVAMTSDTFALIMIVYVTDCDM